MNRHGGDARGDQLPAKHSVKVDRQAARGRARNEIGVRAAGRVQGLHDVLPDLVATTENGWPQSSDEITGVHTL